MSLIRSTSNPEKLYIWDDGKNVNFAVGPQYSIIPIKNFYSFMRKYVNERCGYGDFEKNGIKIEEKIVHHKKKLSKFDKVLMFKPGNFKYELSYNGKLIVRMWTVTWMYIVNNVRWEIKHPIKKKK